MEPSQMAVTQKKTIWGISAIRKMYEWVMNWAEHKQGIYALAFISAIESIFFPLPVDPLLVAMGASRPKKAIWFSLVATIGSVMGAIIGYYIGVALWDGAQDLFYQYVFSQDKMDLVLHKFKENGFISIFIAGFTPIPFKVFTISAGVAELNFFTFILAAFVGRGARFMLLGVFMYKFGAPVKKFIDQHFSKLTIGLGISILAAFVLYKLYFH